MKKWSTIFTAITVLSIFGINFLPVNGTTIYKNSEYIEILDATDPKIDVINALTDDETCMRLNLYHEARGEDLQGLLAVMNVTMARVMSNQFPNTVCEVVWQKNQFEWTEKGVEFGVQIHDQLGWNKVNQIMKFYNVYHDYDPTVVYYHSGEKPRWFQTAPLEQVHRIGNHVFYREISY